MDRSDMKTASRTINGGLVEEWNGGGLSKESQATEEPSGDCLRRRVSSSAFASFARLSTYSLRSSVSLNSSRFLFQANVR